MSKGERGARTLAYEIQVAVKIAERIHLIRGERVMLDEDAVLYGVPTRRLNEAVARNLGRFPDDFMFRLTKDEVTILKSQIATSRGAHGGRRRSTPRAFTEEGVTPAILLGDRITVNALRLDGRAIVVELLDRAAGEPLTASPTVASTRRFEVERALWWSGSSDAYARDRHRGRLKARVVELAAWRRRSTR